MPATFNGIGTHYYGKKNHTQRAGVCQQCGRNVSLSSYDTRLWFVIVFIPIIPLGRKRIVDYCPSCTRHYMMEASQWEAAKQLEITGALEKFRATPTPESAMAVHQQLLAFHQYPQAEEFAEKMKAQFPDSANAQAYLGAALTHVGRLPQADACYARALELRPDMPEARMGVAAARLRENRLDEARRLLDFLEKSGAAQLYSLVPLEQLALAYQAAGHHGPALELFGELLAALPPVGEHAGFRKNVEKSEKALGRKDSLLPKAKFSWRRFIGLDRVAQSAPALAGVNLSWRVVAIIAAAAALLLFGSNAYIHHHRTLQLVNAFDTPATVEVRGVGTVTVGRTAVELVLPEGWHHATISGPVRQEVDFEVRAGFFDRWWDDPAWVLNVGGRALLALEDVVYSKNPRPSTISFYFGEPFFRLPKVTHPFKSLPATVQMKAHEERVLSHLDFFRGERVNLFHFFFHEQQQPARAFNFAEWELRQRPGDEAMLAAYVMQAEGGDQRTRVERFLRAGLTNRPVQIEWHRHFQNFQHTQQAKDRLRPEYEAMQQADPTNSALLYLCGRIAPSREEGRRFFERAQQADAGNPWPPFALGWDLTSKGDWAAARPLLERAVHLRPADEGFKHTFHLARVALGEQRELEAELRARLVKTPLDFRTVLELIELLAAAGRDAEARQEVAGYVRGVLAQDRTRAGQIEGVLFRHLNYVAGNFGELEKATAADKSKAGEVQRFQALVEQGRVAEAVKLRPPESSAEAEPYHLLTVAIAWRLAGDAAQAEAWQARAARLLAEGGNDDARAAALLSRREPPTLPELDAMVLAPNVKAIVLVALAQHHPLQRSALAQAALRLNVERSYPYHLVRRAAEAAR